MWRTFSRLCRGHLHSRITIFSPLLFCLPLLSFPPWACQTLPPPLRRHVKLLDTMWQDSKGPRPNKRTYDLVIQACGHGGEWELGVALIDDMRDLGIRPDTQTFNIAVTACGRSGERLAAETLVANMWKARVVPDEFTYASLVAA